MEQFRGFLRDLWNFLPLAGLANEYHPSTEGGVIPVPFIQAQKVLLDALINGSQNQTLARPILEQPKRSFSAYMQGYSSLPLNDRALICLRSAHLCKARHLMPAIISMALDHGLRNSDIQLICQGRFAPGWSRRELLLIKVTDEIFRSQFIHSKLWKELSGIYHSGQVFDLVLCSAAFHLCVHPDG